MKLSSEVIHFIILGIYVEEVGKINRIQYYQSTGDIPLYMGKIIYPVQAFLIVLL